MGHALPVLKHGPTPLRGKPRKRSFVIGARIAVTSASQLHIFLSHRTLSAKEPPVNCPKCGKPMVNRGGWHCDNKRCPEAHQGELCKKCDQPPVKLVRVVANAGVFKCPNGHEMDCVIE
jgi:hypothetical protein